MTVFNGRNWVLADFLPFKFIENWDAFWSDVIAEMTARVQGVGTALTATSNTSTVAIGVGTKTLTVETGKGFAAGMYVVATDGANSANAITGRVTSYSTSTGVLVISVPSGGTTGGGTPSSWVIGVSGAVGPTGPVNSYWGGTAGGTANALTVTTGASLSVLTAGMIVGLKTGASANSGAATIAVDSVSAVAVRKNGSALSGGEMPANTDIFLQFDGTYLRLLGGSGFSGPFSDIVVVTGATSITAATHLGKMIVCTSTAPYTLTLPAPATFGKGSFGVHNRTTGLITLSPSSGTINGVSTVTVGAGQSTTVTCDGSSYDASGQSAAASSQTWNPSDKASAVTLSGGNLTATGGSGGAGSVRSTSSVSSGKYYWEYSITTADQDYIGVMKSTASISQYVGYDANGYGWWQYNGNKFNNNTGSGTAFGSTWSNGDILSIALDLDNGKIYFAKNNVWQASGDPVAGTNPAFSGLSGAFLPAWSDGATSSVPVGTFRPSSSAWTYAPPSGFGQLP